MTSTSIFAETAQLVSAEMLARSLAPHPRLMADAARWEALRGQVKTDATSARLYALLERKADAMLGEPLIRRELKGRRLLDKSRQFLDRVATLALLHRIGGDPRHAERARREMLAMVEFSDWNPSHFLDTAEISAALAIGLDWLHDALPEAERVRIADALVAKGLRPSLEGKHWWIDRDNNWNPVCHGGLALGALAVAERHPALAVEILNRAIANVPKVAPAYAPDGAYDEGPTYWGYGTLYLVVLVSALQSALHSDFDLSSIPGLMRSAEYMREVVGPTGQYFSYSDGGLRPKALPPMYWFASRANDRRLLDDELKNIDAPGYDHRLLALALVWHRPGGVPSSSPPLAWKGDGRTPVALFRSAWNDPAAVWVGLKGGSPSTSHAHMDAGSFVLEADGVRWALDLGSQDYHSLEKTGMSLFDQRQESQRWDVFRLGSEGHNILRFDGEPQQVAGDARITRFVPGGASPHAVVNLDTLYPAVARAERGIALCSDRRVMVSDAWTARDAPVEAAWQMLTHASAEIAGNTIRLAQEGRTMEMRILSPAGASIRVEDVSEPRRPFDAPNPGTRRIVVGTRTEAGAKGEFRVLFVPGSAPASETPPDFPPTSTGD